MSTPYTDLKVLSIGASRNIGYHAALRLLDHGATVTCLVRKRAALADDPACAPHLAAGRLRLVEGDALVEADVARAWAEAAQGPGPGPGPSGRGEVDYLVFTVGAVPSFSLTRGIYQTPPDLVTRCIVNALATCPTPATRAIVVSTTGLTARAHAGLPLPLRPLYAYLLHNPHVDKRGMERVVARAAGRGVGDAAGWSARDRASAEGVLPPGWEARVPEGSRRESVVVRAALLTDGEAQGDKAAAALAGKPPYRVRGEDEAGYTISRKDVAHFIVEGIVGGGTFGEYAGRVVSISY